MRKVTENEESPHHISFDHHHARTNLGDEVDGNTFTSKTTRSTNTMDVVLTIGG